jgi:hypothetical protein
VPRPAQPQDQSEIFDCDDNIANDIVNNFWPGYDPANNKRRSGREDVCAGPALKEETA